MTTVQMDAESYKEHCLKNPSHLVALTVGYTALQKNVSDLRKKLASTQTQKCNGDGDEALKKKEMEMHALQTKVAQLESDSAAKDNLVAALNTEVQECKGVIQTLVSQMQQVFGMLQFGNSLILGQPDYNETDAKVAVPPKSGSSDQGYFEVYALKSSSSNVSSVSSDRRAGYEMRSLDSMSIKQRPSDVDSVSSAAVGHLEQRMAGVEDKLTHMQKQVEHLSSERQTLETVKRDVHGVHNQMHNLDNRLTQYSNMMEEMSLRQELQEVKTTAGVSVWKITDVQRRYREAMEGKTLSLYSPPFYTSPHGYRMCIRTYLYGDGTGKGSHISVFFVVMKSEHDQLLSWPFKQKVTISLMNQDTPAEQFSHITETFLPDPSSTSFRKPETEMNVASGFPKFVKKSVLKDSRFVKGDTMYLRVRVDRTGLIPE